MRPARCALPSILLGIAAVAAASEPPIYYISDCQPGAATGCVPGDDANLGTSEAMPRRTLASINLNGLPAGSRVLLARGGVWRLPMTLLDNPHLTPAKPLVLDAYGVGDRPWLKAPGLSGAAFAFGKYNNTSNDGGYVLRNLKIDGGGSSATGVFLMHNLRRVMLDNLEITGFYVGVQSQARAPHGVSEITIRNSSISGNRGMGLLGQFSHSVIEGNLFESNNASGSGYNHAIYLSGEAEISGLHNVVRNNVLRHNSVVDGVCRGGNLTVHGQIDDLLIEGNVVEQLASSRTCRGISITSGYRSTEWFKNVVVRGNTLVNLGACSVCFNAAPGIVVQRNRFIQDQETPHVAVSRRFHWGWGDEADRGAVVTDNLGCFARQSERQRMADVAVPGASVSGNKVLAGVAATGRDCAR